MKKTTEVMNVSGATRRQLQFYNNKGLIDASRTKDNHRIYTQESLEQLWEIFIYKEAGFSLEEIKTMKTMDQDKKSDYLDKKKEEFYRRQQELMGKAELVTDIMRNEFPEKPSDEEVASGITYIKKAENYLKKYVEKAGRKRQ